MAQKLQLKMTLFCTVVTGGILTVMILAGLTLFESLLEKNDAAVYEKNVASLSAFLDGQHVIQYDKLCKIVDTRYYTVILYDNGRPYLWHRDPKKILLGNYIREKARDDYGFDIINTPKLRKSMEALSFQTEYDKNPHLITLAPVSNKYGTLCLSVIYERRQLTDQISQLRIWMCCIVAAAFFFLFLFAWLFSKKLLRPVEENRKRQIQFTASAAHELRSPLSVILSSAEALGVADVKDRGTFQEVIISEGRRMSRLIEDMLSLTGADNGTWTVQMEQVPMDTLLLNVYEAYGHLVQKQKLRFKIDIPEETLPYGICDKQRIEQVLGILLDNAITYTPRGGDITVGIQKVGSKLKLWVANTGPGIPDEQKNRIFDRFYRMDIARKDKQRFGLGLSIAQEIIRLHKGKIWVEDCPDGGVRFCFTIYCVFQSVL